MINYRTLVGAALVSMVAAAPAFAQQGAPGGSLYKDPASTSYLSPRVDNNQSAAQADADRDRAAANAAYSRNPQPSGSTNGDGASGVGASSYGNPSLIGPRFGGG